MSIICLQKEAVLVVKMQPFCPFHSCLKGELKLISSRGTKEPTNRLDYKDSITEWFAQQNVSTIRVRRSTRMVSHWLNEAIECIGIRANKKHTEKKLNLHKHTQKRKNKN